MELLNALIASIFSFNICNLFTHPNSKIWQHYPKVKIKRVELLPSIRITIKGRVIHFHHWMNLSLLLIISIVVGGGILDSWIFRGIVAGGIVQGLTTPSSTARKLIYKKTLDV